MPINLPINGARKKASADLDRRIIAALRYRNGITATQLAPLVHASISYTLRRLRVLQDKGQTRHDGKGRSLVWFRCEQKLQKTPLDRPPLEWKPLKHDIHAHRRLAELTRK